MISYQAVLTELEKHIQAAKSASTEQQFREALVATKALCDVVLQFPTNEQQKTMEYKEIRQVSENAQLQTTMMNSVFTTSSQRLEEEDGANGASIFDF